LGPFNGHYRLNMNGTSEQSEHQHAHFLSVDTIGNWSALMPATPNLDLANNAGFLWPSVADALDTFLRRRHQNLDPYEKVWRLIHLWEAIEITLALAVMSRLIGEPAAAGILRRQREFFYGKTWDISLEQFKSMQGASQGAIDQWINILDEIARMNDPPGRFLRSVKGLLAAVEVDMAPLLLSWSKACDVPTDYKRDKVDVKTAMRYVNSFRNRLAHVPFPHDPLGEVADAVELATEQLFSVVPLSNCHEKAGQSSALTGAFRVGRCFLHGGQMEFLQEGSTEGIQFVFPCRKKAEDNEVWQAEPMLHLDSMMRPHILTRIKGHDVCEYTRFRAEANAVLVQLNGGIAASLPEPSKIEYFARPEPEAESLTVPGRPVERDQNPATAAKRDLSMSEAIEAIRSEDYDPAIEFFARLTQARPSYHIGWLRLGYAKRERAVRLDTAERVTAIRLLGEAVEDLSRASQHVDTEYQALAWYERSKAWFHLGRLQPEIEENRTNCIEDAEKAFALSDEKKFLSWLEHVQNFSGVSLGGTARGAAVVTGTLTANLGV
jgi:hypothetical protein